ncbi:MAG: hypothetical protein E7468_02600 [Ruminococcaceae bacterium]|nr:hypothetical protein [Oscillospiraceae bacterium]
MKKVISALLLLAMVIGCFAGCAPEVKEDAGLNSAKEYLYTMYKDAEAKTAVDYTVVGQVRINDVTYPITWTVDKTENVKIESAENNMVAVKLTPSTEDVNYKLTATLKNAEGQEASVSFDHFIPKADGLPATLADGTYVIVAGNLTMSSLAADKSYGYPTATEVTVADGKVSGHVAADVLTIKNVDGGFTIQDAQGRYFYLKGTYNSFNVDATAPAEGHVFSILVKDGKYLIQNNLDKKTLAYSTSYSSWGCYPELTDDHTSLVDIIAATAPSADAAPEAPGYDPTGKTPAEIVDAAYALENGKAMSAAATLTGVISSVDTPWDDGYKNITVTIKVAGKEDKPIMCFRLKGDGAKDLKVGDTITCTGTIKNYNGTIEFDAGCQVSNIVAGAGSTTPPATNPPATNSPAVTTGASVTFDFSSLTEKGKEITADTALSVFNGAASGSGLTAVSLTKVYNGNGTGGQFENTAGLLKLGTSKVDGQMVLTFSKKVAKVEILSHGWKSGTDMVSINGSAEQQLANNGTASTLTFNLDGSSETITIDVAQRAFIFKIIVTFVG